MTERIDSEVTAKADRLLDKMEGGDDITVDYNRMSVEEQRQIFAAMRQIQAKGDYDDVTLTGTDDGRLKDAQADKSFLDITSWFGSPTIDVYDTPEDIQAKLQGHSEDLARSLGTNTRQQQLDRQEGQYK